MNPRVLTAMASAFLLAQSGVAFASDPGELEALSRALDGYVAKKAWSKAAKVAEDALGPRWCGDASEMNVRLVGTLTVVARRTKRTDVGVDCALASILRGGSSSAPAYYELAMLVKRMKPKQLDAFYRRLLAHEEAPSLSDNDGIVCSYEFGAMGKVLQLVLGANRKAKPYAADDEEGLHAFLHGKHTFDRKAIVGRLLLESFDEDPSPVVARMLVKSGRLSVDAAVKRVMSEFPSVASPGEEFATLSKAEAHALALAKEDVERPDVVTRRTTEGPLSMLLLQARPKGADEDDAVRTYLYSVTTHDASGSHYVRPLGRRWEHKAEGASVATPRLRSDRKTGAVYYSSSFAEGYAPHYHGSCPDDVSDDTDVTHTCTFSKEGVPSCARWNYSADDEVASRFDARFFTLTSSDGTMRFSAFQSRHLKRWVGPHTSPTLESYATWRAELEARVRADMTPAKEQD